MDLTMKKCLDGNLEKESLHQEAEPTQTLRGGLQMTVGL